MDLRTGEAGQEVEPRLQHLQPCDLTPSWQRRYQQRRLQMLPGSPPYPRRWLGASLTPGHSILHACVCALSGRSCEQILIKASDCVTSHVRANFSAPFLFVWFCFRYSTSLSLCSFVSNTSLWCWSVSAPHKVGAD